MTEFHFIRPWWLLAIVALLFAIYLLKKYRINQSGWHQLLPQHLAKVLVIGNHQQQKLSLIMPFFIGLLAIIALAGPTWQKLPQPVYQLARGSVLIMDMSYSMYSTDLAPNRLTRARFKALDLLEKLNEGEMGLIAYAGDAFVISPLTEDINNIKLLLPSLSPDLMPEPGSNPLAALTLANEMLLNAGHVEGNIYWFTDGIDREDSQDITEWSREHPHKLNILGVGTPAGAPIKLPNGELMKDNHGAIIVPKLTDVALRGAAHRGRGNYQSLSLDAKDIESLLSESMTPKNSTEQQKDAENLSTGDQWQETGPYFLLLLLPLVLGYFRRGKLLSLLPLLILLYPSEQAHAELWQDLWKTSDQQAQEKFNNNDFSAAAEQFNDPLWQGSAHYKAGNYQQALESFQQFDSAQALYNQGNALAQLQQLDEAINAYDQALAQDPTLADAKTNKALVEQLKQQQQNQAGDGKDQQQNQENQENPGEQDQNEQGDQEKQQNGEQQQQNNQQGNEQAGDDSPSQDSSNNQQNKSEDSQNDRQDQQNSDKNDHKDSEQTEQQLDEDKQNAKENAQQANSAKELSTEEMQAQSAADELAKETEQKHQQLLNKVTDDPYLLLRNKMQIEYQKRRQNQSTLGVTKKW